jgi:hypothetical protein
VIGIVSSCESRIASCELQNASCESEIASCVSEKANQELQVAIVKMLPSIYIYKQTSASKDKLGSIFIMKTGMMR